MPISFAGFDLALETEEIQEDLNEFLPTAETAILSDFLGADRTNRNESRNSNAPLAPGVARPNYPPPPPLRINSLYWPTGATRWGRFLGLADTETKDKIVAAVGGVSSAPIVKDLVLVDESVSPAVVLTAKMYLLPPRRLTQVETGNGSGTQPPHLWLIPLVDVRYLWQFNNTGALTIAAADTWSSFFNSLGSRLGLTISTGTIAAAYLNPDPYECSRAYESTAALADAGAHSVGRRMVVNLDGTTVRAMDFAYALTTLNANIAKNWAQIMGGDFDAGKWATQATVELICPKYVANVQSCGSSKLSGTVGSGYASTVRTIHTTCASMRSTFGGSESNTTDLQALADKIAADLLLSMKFYDRTFAGLLDWSPCSWDDHIEWTIGRWHPSGVEMAQTRVQSSPYNFGVDEMLHQVATRVFPVGNYIAKTNAAISALSGSTPGSGAISIYETNLSTGDLDDTGIDGLAFNSTATASGSGVWVQLKHDGCRLWLDTEDC